MVKGKILFPLVEKCLYCEGPLERPRRALYALSCNNEKCDPHKNPWEKLDPEFTHDPRRCPRCGSAFYNFVTQQKGETVLNCGVCELEFYASTLIRTILKPG